MPEMRCEEPHVQPAGQLLRRSDHRVRPAQRGRPAGGPPGALEGLEAWDACGGPGLQ